MLDHFFLPKNAYHSHRTVQGLERVFGATIFFGPEEQRQKPAILDVVRFHFFDRVHIWYNREGTVNPNGDESDNTIALSEAFHNENRPAQESDRAAGGRGFGQCSGHS
jgi:hypothetical protein